MTNVKVSSEGPFILIKFEVAQHELSDSHVLFNMFAFGVDFLESVEDEGTKYRFTTTNDNERRILELLESLSEQNQDINITHDSDISKNIATFKRERVEFELFASNALRIRNNLNHDFSELEGFEESVKNLNEGLFWHQSLSAYHMAFSRNSCNFSVPGAGKTRVVYAAYNYLQQIGEVEKIIIVGPLSSAVAWEGEYVKVFGKQPDILMIAGGTPAAQINKIYGGHSPQVIHVTFQSLPLVSAHIKYLTSKYKVMMVVDEAHRIKNPDGYWSKSLLELVDDIDTAPVSRVVLSGTPAPNSYVDLHNLFKFIWPKNQIIEYNLAALKQMSQKPNLISNQRKINRLVEKIAPFYIRVRKTDLGLPEITINEPCVATPDFLHIEIHDYIKNDLIKEMKERGELGHYGLRTIRLRQAASNPSLLMLPVNPDEYNYTITGEKEDYLENIREKIIEYNKSFTSTKFSECMNLVTSLRAKHKKILIWCEFIGTVKKLSEILKQQGISHALLTGQNSDFETRKSIIDDFNSPIGEFEVIIATTAAVGESISLHHECHDAIYLEVSYNAGQHLQSMDRIHRLGLAADTKTNYWYIQSDFDLEKHILKRLREKEAAMRKIVDSKEIPLISDYRQLFTDPYEYADLRDLLKITKEINNDS